MDTMACNAGLTACQKTACWDEALPILESLRLRQLRGDIVTYTAVLSGLNRGGCWMASMALSLEAPDCDEALRIATLAGAGVGRWDQALARLHRDDGVRSYGVAIKACEDFAEWPAALRLLGAFEARRLASQAVALNSGLSACEKGMQWQAAIQLLSTFEDKRWKTDVITRSAAITACAVVAKWPFSLQLFHQIPRADTVALNAALAACEQGGQWQVALLMLQSASQLVPPLDLVSFNSALSACAAASAWEWALRLFEEVHEASLEKDAITYSAALTAHAGASFWQEALALFEELCLQNRADSGAAAAAIAACGTAAQWAAALGMLEAEVSGDAHEDANVLRVTCMACCQGNQWQRAALLALTMAELSSTLDPQIYSMIITARMRATA
ncbi:unnamed protein product [Symbiodinium natans]|uniref:Pentatricopeptide repeat-containing protein, chloroplastic n=1 Tax=Symbiodinium natans TaxID=878477 RepID=A0A812T279_9DINO|nr:unnamed protein product [Symbiodinium natans]